MPASEHARHRSSAPFPISVYFFDTFESGVREAVARAPRRPGFRPSRRERGHQSLSLTGGSVTTPAALTRFRAYEEIDFAEWRRSGAVPRTDRVFVFLHTLLRGATRDTTRGYYPSGWYQ
jgi:hypothetical protein